MGNSTIDEPLRVLVIEDEETILEFLRVGLAYEHFEVQTATDGPSGLVLARQVDFDLIILDVMLPGLDGFEVCRQLRQAGFEVPIVMLTARKEVPDRVAGLNLGADDYLTKPFSFDELLARINAVLRRRGKSSTAPVLRALDLTLKPEMHEVYKHDTPLDYRPSILRCSSFLCATRVACLRAKPCLIACGAMITWGIPTWLMYM
jgi:DNA-binding response OmpR family regulator